MSLIIFLRILIVIVTIPKLSLWNFSVRRNGLLKGSSRIRFAETKNAQNAFSNVPQKREPSQAGRVNRKRNLNERRFPTRKRASSRVVGDPRNRKQSPRPFPFQRKKDRSELRKTVLYRSLSIAPRGRRRSARMAGNKRSAKYKERTEESRLLSSVPGGHRDGYRTDQWLARKFGDFLFLFSFYFLRGSTRPLY